MNDMLSIECPPTWRPGARIAICGEAPGEHEVEEKEGFVGAAGRLLGKILGASGLSREDVSLTNVVKRRPPGSNFRQAFYEQVPGGKKSALRPTQELLRWTAVLYSELLENRPAVVLACGNEALKALVSLEGISHRRGSVYWYKNQSQGMGRVSPIDSPSQLGWPGCWVVSLLHPAAIYHGALWQEVFVSGHIVRRAKRISEYPKWKPRTWGEFIALEGYEAIDWLQNFLPGCERWAMDLEWVPGTISALGVAVERKGETNAVCIPWPDLGLWREIKPLMEAQGHSLVNHNLLADLEWLERIGGIRIENPHMDTMHAWHILHPELPKKLEFVTMWYLGQDIPYYKSEGKVGKGLKRRMTQDEKLTFWRYNIKDAVAALWISQELDMELGNRCLVEKYHTWYMDNWEAAREMQSRGLAWDEVQAGPLRDAVLGRLAGEKKSMQEILGDPAFNPGSDKQVHKALYETFALPTQRKKSGALTADYEALKQIQIKSPSEFVRRLQVYNKLEKVGRDYL